MAFAKRVDKNQKDIVETFRKLGATVIDLSKVGKGLPDLLIGFNNKTALVEIKASKKSKLTPHQEAFFREWNGGMLARVNDVDGAIRVINLLNS
jgi:Holliday junction resolvase